MGEKCWHSNCLCNKDLRICMCADKLPWGRAVTFPSPFDLSNIYFNHTSTSVHGGNGGVVSQREAEQQDSASALSCCVCWILRLHAQTLTPGQTWALCVGEVWPVRYLRGDTGAPAHALLAAPSWGCPPHSLGAVLYTSAAARHQGSSWRVAPRWWCPSSLHALPPALLHRWPSWTGVVVMMAALVTWPCARAAAAPVWPVRAPGWVLLLMVTPASWRSGKAIAEGLRGDVW